MKRVALALALSVVGCGGSGYEVVRVHAGRAQVGRFVSSAAYQATLEASIAEEKGDWKAAVAAWTRARDEDPDGPELQAKLGVALCHVGKHAAGEFALNDALRIDPELELAWTGRARCKLMRAQSKSDWASARADLMRALQADGDALEPELMLVELDVKTGELPHARARAEEAVVLHPSSSQAWRALAEVAARQGDGKRALIAALRAGALDDDVGKQAKKAVLDVVDRGGVAADSLALRGTVPPVDRNTAEGLCGDRLRALEAIARRAEPQAIELAAQGVRAACPGADARATIVEVMAIWSPENAEEVEARAFAAPSGEARRWASRMRLRRKSIAELLEPEALPRAEDRSTLALHLAVAALRDNDGVLAKGARDLDPTEPTVARLAAEVARKAGRGKDDPARKAACALARTKIELADCAR